MKLITLFKRGRNIITVPQYHLSPDVLPIALKCLHALCMWAFRTMFCMSCPSPGLKRTVLMKKVSNILALHMPCLSIKAFNKRELHERQNVFHLLLSISFLLSDQNRWGMWCYSMKLLEFLFILSPHVEETGMKADVKLAVELPHYSAWSQLKNVSSSFL